jgi:hypothetical protein
VHDVAVARERSFAAFLIGEEERHQQAIVMERKLRRDLACDAILFPGIHGTFQDDGDVDVGVLARIAAGVGAVEPTPSRRSP